MDKLSIVDNTLISVWVYPERKMIHHLMKAFCHGDEFREALSKGLEAMARHGATKWLSDDRANGALVPDDEEWAVTVWSPRARAVGWRHWGIVQPGKLIGQVAMARFIKTYADLGINARMFSDPEEAMKWLEEQ